MGCCDKMLQSIIFLFNFIFFLTSAALIGIGAYIQIHMTKYLDFLGNTYLNTSIILIIIGAVMLVVTFCGCCGACTDNACMVYTYGTMLALILISLIGVAITVYIYKDDAREIIKTSMNNAMEQYKKPGHEGVTDAMDIVQKDFKCCGVEKYSDWKQHPFGQSGDVPDMCCKVTEDGCGKGMADKSEEEAASIIYTQGCFAGLEDLINSNVGASAGVGVGVIVLLFLGVLTSCCVARKMRETNDYV